MKLTRRDAELIAGSAADLALLRIERQHDLADSEYDRLFETVAGGFQKALEDLELEVVLLPDGASV
ncbi:MAG TPA: hypothetical protein VHV75_09910 [Solirubrobacteraceae bacterium]|jgi:hypothetical protein|nr:hypothetical protein [Solirubrobacteraceae bacterium]